MAKVITLSRIFPAYHKRKGQPTYFVEQFIKGRPERETDELNLPDKSLAEQMILAVDIWLTLGRKYHTIRAGKRFKKGDYFSPRVWSGKPYNSKQIILAPDTLIENIIDIDFVYDEDVEEIDIRINGKWYCQLGSEASKEIAENDGLTIEDFTSWFNLKKGESFNGQIIIWNDNPKCFYETKTACH